MPALTTPHFRPSNSSCPSNNAIYDTGTDFCLCLTTETAHPYHLLTPMPSHPSCCLAPPAYLPLWQHSWITSGPPHSVGSSPPLPPHQNKTPLRLTMFLLPTEQLLPSQIPCLPTREVDPMMALRPVCRSQPPAGPYVLGGVLMGRSESIDSPVE